MKGDDDDGDDDDDDDDDDDKIDELKKKAIVCSITSIFFLFLIESQFSCIFFMQIKQHLRCYMLFKHHLRIRTDLCVVLDSS